MPNSNLIKTADTLRDLLPPLLSGNIIIYEIQTTYHNKDYAKCLTLIKKYINNNHKILRLRYIPNMSLSLHQKLISNSDVHINLSTIKTLGQLSSLLHNDQALLNECLLLFKKMPCAFLFAYTKISDKQNLCRSLIHEIFAWGFCSGIRDNGLDAACIFGDWKTRLSTDNSLRFLEKVFFNEL